MKREIIALPGFLGLSSDWSLFQNQGIVGFNLDSFEWNHLWDWAKKFNEIIKAKGNEKKILMGYSLGGRLALHALIENPALWEAAIIISAHPGLISDQEKQERIKNDRRWGDRFLNEDWEEIMTDWNAQSVFVNDRFDFMRCEADYERIKLQQLLEKASLGYQDDLRKQVELLSIPILWVTGELDRKYTAISEGVLFSNEKSKKEIIVNAGHRVPWEQPETFKVVVNSFLNS